MPIRVGNAEPVVKIVEPKAGAFFAWGQALPFKIEVTDDEDGSTADGKLPAAKIQVSGTYYVHDGYHRVSISRALG